MTSIVHELLPTDLISRILASPEAQTNTGSFYLSSFEIKEHLLNKWGLDIGDKIPMRWISGDTASHTDIGEVNGQYTYLAYLTDSPGQLILDGTGYPIASGTGYQFPSGTRHGTINTGSVPRLLLGPMNEFGLPVGAPNSVEVPGGTITIGIIDTFSTVYRIGDGEWTLVSTPLYIFNTSLDNTKLVVLFEDGMELRLSDQYFVCGSNNIQFGSTSSISTITVKDTLGYAGLINNGNMGDSYDIEVYNIKVVSSNSTLLDGAGWIGSSNFGTNCTNYIVNCHSTGDIPSQCGGIVGGAAGISGSMTIIGCSSSGAISGGGIVGPYANNVNCISCWSTGNIGSSAGGIFGEHSGQLAGSQSNAMNCFSTGTLHSNAGGIFGSNAGNWLVNNDGQTSAVNCYSLGAIPNSGGIYGPNVKRGTMTNCYSVGTTTLYKSAATESTIESSSNNYAALSWSTVNAASALTGTPGINGVGTTWISLSTPNTPYLLRNMGYSPYTTNNISTEGPALISIYSASLYGSETTISGPTGTYQIINVTNNVTINSSTGVITTNFGTSTGELLIIVLKQMDNSGYSVSEVALTIKSQMIGDTMVHIRQQDADIEYSYDQETWNIVNAWPLGIRNTGDGIFRVIFDTNITLVTTEQYLVPLTDRIQIGNTSLNTDGSIPEVTIDGVTDYPGLIKNGSVDSLIEGRQYIYVFNLRVNESGSTLAQGGGWFGQIQYARGASFNYFINCHSSGDISTEGGGIVGAYAVSYGSSPELRLISCSSSGSIGQYGGGIVGYRAALFNNLVCSGCWSTGSIGNWAGGIIGSTLSGSATIERCYSTGNRSGSDAGGIMGSHTSYNDDGRIDRCYSLGTGGVGIGVVGSGTKFTVTNCYCLNELLGSGVGISAYTYAAEGNWSDVTASENLYGAPVSTVGTHWISPSANQPYELRDMGYSPYLLEIIGYEGNVPGLVTASLSAYVGGPSSACVNPNTTCRLLSLTPDESSISMDTTGKFTVRLDTPKGVYYAVVRSTGSYHITELSLTVQDDPTVPCLLYGTRVLTPHGYQRVEDLNKGDYIMTNGRSIRIRNIYCTRVIGDQDTCPSIITRDSISKNYPPADFRISQAHLIKYEDNWVNPGYYPVDLSYINKEIVYYHIQLPNYCTDHLTIDDGIIVESLGSSKLDFIEYERRILASIAYQASKNSNL